MTFFAWPVVVAAVRTSTGSDNRADAGGKQATGSIVQDITLFPFIPLFFCRPLTSYDREFHTKPSEILHF